MAEHIQIDSTDPRIAYTATAGQTVFDVPFSFFDEADLRVYVNGTLKTLRTDYVTSGAGETGGGTITFTSGRALNDIVIITRVLDIARTTDFPNSGPLSTSSLNTELDRIVAMLQQIETSITRIFTLPESDETVSIQLPTKSARASKFLGFDANGAPVASLAVTGVTVSSFMETVLDDTSASAARATLGITDVSAYAGLSNWRYAR